MPKIIKNLNSKILKTAMMLYEDNGYDSIDMKMIADELDVAVGTLYNYYENKKELYLAVLVESWKTTLNSIKRISASHYTPIEKFEITFSILQEEIIERKKLGRILVTEALMLPSNEANKSVLSIIDKLNKTIENLLVEYLKHTEKKLTETELKKWTTTLISTFFSLFLNFPEDSDENIDFIVNMIKKI